MSLVILILKVLGGVIMQSFSRFSMIKKTVIFLFVVCLLLCAFMLGACDDTAVQVGKYYLTGSDSVYVEVLSNNKITFVGIDFSEVIEDLNSEHGSKVSESDFEGIKDFTFVKEEMEIRVYITIDSNSGVYVSFKYSDGKLTREGQEYILRTENNNNR